MAQRITEVKVKQNGVYGNAIPLSVKAENVLFLDEKETEKTLPVVLDTKVNQATYSEVILLKEQWGAFELPKNVYPLNKMFSSALYDLEILAYEKTTKGELKALMEANISSNLTDNNLIAKGKIPKEDIHILLKVVAKNSGNK